MIICKTETTRKYYENNKLIHEESEGSTKEMDNIPCGTSK